MNFLDLFQLLPQIMPLVPRLTKAIALVEKVTADPEAKDALAALDQLLAILRAHDANQAQFQKLVGK